MIGEVISLMYIMYYSSHLYFIEGQGACAYIIVVFATWILASPIKSPKLLLKNRRYKSH